MNILDIIILICFALSLIQGFRKGFISQAISIISIIAGIWASARFADMASEWIGQYITASEQVLKITAFAIIIICVFTILGVLGRILEASIKLVFLGWVNKVLGMLFSLLKCMLILGLAIMAFEAVNNIFHLVKHEILAQSELYVIVRNFANNVFPYLKSLFSVN